MSKESKFLSIAVDMAYGRQKDENSDYSLEMDAGKLNELILWLEELCNHKKIYYSPVYEEGQKGRANIQVLDENGHGIVSEVKLFPLKKEEKVEECSPVNGRIDMIREVTDYNGRLSLNIPFGNYYVEISKGSEYEIVRTKLVIVKEQTTELNFRITPIINLKEDGWFSGDLHHHSIYSSPVYGGTDPVVESPKEVALSMMAMGTSYGALSDHHNILNHKEWKDLKSKDFTPIVSKEISTSNGHVMAMGVEEDIIYQIPPSQDREDQVLRQEFLHITDRIKELGGLPQINHPKDHSKAISWNPAFDDMISIFETMEIWNGSNPMVGGTTNYKAFLFWQNLLIQDIFIPATAGSDTHNTLANDYHSIFDKILWLGGLIKNNEIELPARLNSEINFLLEIIEKEMPLIEKWAKTNLTSAGVRTFVHVEGEVTSDKLLEGLRRGHSFLTNGPILIPEIDGKIPGDTVKTQAEKKDIKLKLLANKPLKNLYLYIYKGEDDSGVYNGNIHRTEEETKGMKEERKGIEGEIKGIEGEIKGIEGEIKGIEEIKVIKETKGIEIINIALNANPEVSGKYDYSQVLPQIPIKGVRWMFFIAKDDFTNMAISNPIFLERIE